MMHLHSDDDKAVESCPGCFSIQCRVCGIALPDDDDWYDLNGEPVCVDPDACVNRWLAERAAARRLDLATRVETR